jgi:L-alanine-DL-glutamate epimerase-like enolase superfamily enzyme
MSKRTLKPITDARVIVTCPGRNFVTLKIETADGSFGLGDATLNGRELAVVSYLSDHVQPAQYPYQRAYLPVNRLEDGTMTNW